MSLTPDKPAHLYVYEIGPDHVVAHDTDDASVTTALPSRSALGSGCSERGVGSSARRSSDMPLTLDEFTCWRRFAATLKNTRGYDNQDAYAYDEHTFVVADGVSRSDNPAAAARAVVDFAVSVPSPCGTGKDWADQLLTIADRRAREAGGLTTVTGLRFLQREPDGSTRTVVFHVGDSMLLRVRGDRVDRLTTPHSVVEGLVKARVITREQAKTHAWRNVITSALGDMKDRQVRLLDVSDRDALVLCTDGVHGGIEGRDVLRCLAAEDPAAALVEAGRASGSSDDATAIVLMGPQFAPRWYLFDKPGTGVMGTT